MKKMLPMVNEKTGNLKQIQSRLDSRKATTTLLAVIRDLFLVKISRCLETRENKSKDLIATATVILEEGKCLPTNTNMFIRISWGFMKFAIIDIEMIKKYIPNFFY